MPTKTTVSIKDGSYARVQLRDLYNHVNHMHADQLFVHPNLFSRLMSTRLSIMWSWSLRKPALITSSFLQTRPKVSFRTVLRSHDHWFRREIWMDQKWVGMHIGRGTISQPDRILFMSSLILPDSWLKFDFRILKLRGHGMVKAIF